MKRALDSWWRASTAAITLGLSCLTLPLCSAYAQQAQTATDDALIQRGAYLARVGDCMACHTVKGGSPFAGGLALPTPVGTVYSTNITPDKETGIGTYSYQDFDRALRQGVAKSGDTLYPAMPYPSYARINPGDVQALYAYFMLGVAPVHQANSVNGIAWPLSMRWPLALWRHAFAPATLAENTTTDAGSDPQLMRGRYLVEGLGHCGACHTPRGPAYQELALTDAGGGTFLSGGVVEHWLAQNLRADSVDGLGRWSAGDIVEFLKSGRNDHAAAFGGMSDVIQDSTQYMSDADLQAIAVYLKSLKPIHADGSAPLPDSTTSTALRAGDTRVPGALLFINNCAACHRSDGKGYPGVFPTLAQSATVNASDPVSLIHLVLRGSSMPATAAAPTVFTMPAFASRLSDAQVADVVSFIRSAWGNHAPAVNANDVSQIRKATRSP